MTGEFNDLVPTLDEVEDEEENSLSTSLFNNEGSKLNGTEVCNLGPTLLVASNCFRAKKKAGSSSSEPGENEQIGDSVPESLEDGIGESPIDPPSSSKPVTGVGVAFPAVLEVFTPSLKILIVE
jgi:hypothetical protein